MRWYSFYELLPDGRRNLLARLVCRSDAHAADEVSASMFPEAQVFEGGRLVATLPPRQHSAVTTSEW